MFTYNINDPSQQKHALGTVGLDDCEYLIAALAGKLDFLKSKGPRTNALEIQTEGTFEDTALLSFVLRPV